MSQRLDVRKMLLKRGWREPRGIGRVAVKGDAVWAPSNDHGDSSLSARRGDQTMYTIGFASDVPTRVIVAACEAAASRPSPPTGASR